jgi:hypothetical protein
MIFTPSGWNKNKGHVAFLMKDLILFAASFCLLKEDVIGASELSALSAIEKIRSRDEALSANSTRS